MKRIAIVIGILACSNVFSNPSSSFWQDYQNDGVVQQRGIQEKSLVKRSLRLNEQSLKEFLNGDDVALSLKSTKGENLTLEVDLPLPDGTFVRVKAIDSPILSPAIREQYPEIKTWSVQGVDDAAVTGRLDFTVKGFHGMLSMPNGDTVYIDPDKNKLSGVYQSLSKLDNSSHFHTDFNCSVHEDHSLFEKKDDIQSAKKELAQIPALSMITYNLALAGTGEYTASQGGTSASAYSSMITTINRVNQIYQRDLGIRLQIVTDDSFAYTDSASDPYTNNNAPTLTAENIDNFNTNFGAGNYDIGHVFAQGSLGGLAYVGAVCLTDYKAGGATGITNPQGEIFSIEYVGHEMGHQLGAHHTFNSQLGSCGGANRTGATAVEPGSGSTIMSYSGLCGSDNLQTHSDAMFHWTSISEINSYTRSASGSACGSRASTGNQKPEANAGGNALIPINTPFLLDGSATGGSTFAWDQIDAGSASTVNTDTGNNAIIRALLPSSAQDRYIPRLSNLFAGNTTKGENLPQTVRNLNFAFVVRDGSGGVGTAFKTIFTRDTGSTFNILSHSISQTLQTNQPTDVVWSVAATDAAPISCANVDISLLRVNGTQNTLLLNTANDGSETLVIPSSTPTMTNARIMVACSTQPFFQISSGNIEVQVGAADTTAPVITINGSNPISIALNSTYSDAGASALDDIDGVVSVATSGTVDTAVAGVYIITYTAIDVAGNIGMATRTVNVNATVDTTPPVITITGPVTINLEQGDAYSDAGATALDDIDGVVPATSSDTVNTSIVGTYLITYAATDTSGNTATSIRTVVVNIDATAPVIVLNGSSTIEITQGFPYVDVGAVATDNFDAVVSVSKSGIVDINVLGLYTITYTATDAAGNTSTKDRSVVVIPPDTQAPVITLNGLNPVSVLKDSEYTELGAGAIDDRDGVVFVNISGEVETSIIGDYIITYTAIDTAGNTATTTRNVSVTVVADTTPPVITLTGGLAVTTIVDEAFVEPGYSAFDGRDGEVDVVISGVVDTSSLGFYNITYTAIDAAGNEALIIRSVEVIKAPDTEAPVITLEGETIYTLEEGQEFVDPGFSAFDDKDGIISVVVTGTVDTSVTGTYVLTYTATDAAGNVFIKTRTVIVEESSSNGEHGEAESSSGGSFGFLLFPLALLGFRRKK